MDVRGESVAGTATRDVGGGEPGAGEPLPDLLALDLAELRTIGHPVLREVVEDLRERAARSSETLWGFDSVL
ncbi:FxSxx-COOH protein [Streptomyces sp. ID05-04B]|uniref:FxSxx-COOH cyclophane-containing RiPP peptide n=1 Tax=unclassified Streptomyces TaxID=2593676 RepID=UPI000D1B6E85|nr:MULTISPECIES: FxSxx-COOH cyclophane-containing RiPP peptide [unclassified Streptomyces]AVV40521.1 FXSXX-COOH protein [Streptomyces sp. P3]MDX5568859.1 FxSxx-COOH protein [Streptomyces sp. ID05-04B]